MAAIIISTIQPRMISLQIGFFGDIRRICIIFFYVLSGTLFDIRQPLAYGKDNNKLLTPPIMAYSTTSTSTTTITTTTIIRITALTIKAIIILTTI